MNVDPSGMRYTCRGKTCEEIEDDIRGALRGYYDTAGNWVKGIIDRVTELFTDDCCLYELFLPSSRARPCIPDPRCLDPVTGNLRPGIGHWEGHLQQANQVYRKLYDIIECYLHKGVDKWLNQGLDTDMCDINSNLLGQATAWLGVNVGEIIPRRHDPGQTFPYNIPERIWEPALFPILPIPNPLSEFDNEEQFESVDSHLPSNHCGLFGLTCLANDIMEFINYPEFNLPAGVGAAIGIGLALGGGGSSAFLTCAEPRR